MEVAVSKYITSDVIPVLEKQLKVCKPVSPLILVVHYLLTSLSWKMFVAIAEEIEVTAAETERTDASEWFS